LNRRLDGRLARLDDSVLAVKASSQEDGLFNKLGFAILVLFIVNRLFLLAVILNAILLLDLLDVAVVDRLVRIFVLQAEPSLIEVGSSAILDVIHTHSQ